MAASISIVIADAQSLVRLGIRQLLGERPKFCIAAEVDNEEELVEALEIHSPTLVILDYDQPNHFRHQTIQVIKQHAPSTQILIISADNNKASIFQALEFGVNSFLTKTCGEDEILDAIKATSKGEKFFCSKVLDYILERTFPKQEENCAPIPLSPREIEIVRLVAKGLIAKEIADELNLSTHTVYTHRKNIMKKLRLNTSSELVLYAVHNGIVERQVI